MMEVEEKDMMAISAPLKPLCSMFDMMEVEEKDMMRAILEDVKTLKGKVEVIEGMLETLVEIYTDAFYEVKDEYLEKIEEIRKERGKVFSSIEDFDRYFE